MNRSSMTAKEAFAKPPTPPSIDGAAVSSIDTTQSTRTQPWPATTTQIATIAGCGSGGVPCLPPPSFSPRPASLSLVADQRTRCTTSGFKAGVGVPCSEQRAAHTPLGLDQCVPPWLTDEKGTDAKQKAPALGFPGAEHRRPSRAVRSLDALASRATTAAFLSRRRRSVLFGKKRESWDGRRVSPGGAVSLTRKGAFFLSSSCLARWLRVCVGDAGLLGWATNPIHEWMNGWWSGVVGLAKAREA